MRLFLCAALVAAFSCARDNQAPDGGSVPVIGGITFRIGTGTARLKNGVQGLYLTDQPDACLAITAVPNGKFVVLSMLVGASGASGTGLNEAIFVPGRSTPAPGEAIAELAAQTGTTVDRSYTASDGTVSWMDNSDGTFTIVSLDLGFDGASDRLVLGPVTFGVCDE